MSKKTDPVCKMELEETAIAAESEYMGETYYFCSTSCKTKFDERPNDYRKTV